MDYKQKSTNLALFRMNNKTIMKRGGGGTDPRSVPVPASPHATERGPFPGPC